MKTLLEVTESVKAKLSEVQDKIKQLEENQRKDWSGPVFDSLAYQKELEASYKEQLLNLQLIADKKLNIIDYKKLSLLSKKKWEEKIDKSFNRMREIEDKVDESSEKEYSQLAHDYENAFLETAKQRANYTLALQLEKL